MLEKFQKVVQRYTGNENITVVGSMQLLSDMGLSSYEMYELICEVEDEFNIAVPDEVISRFKTVQDIIDFISAN